MPVRVHEYVRVEALVLVHAECAVGHETERRVMFAHDVRREMDRVDDPQDDEEPPFSGGKEPHGRTPRTGRQTTTSPPPSVPGNMRTGSQAFSTRSRTCASSMYAPSVCTIRVGLVAARNDDRSSVDSRKSHAGRSK